MQAVPSEPRGLQPLGRERALHRRPLQHALQVRAQTRVIARRPAAEAARPAAEQVAALLSRFEVGDLEVGDPPIDELIGGLFRREAGR